MANFYPAWKADTSFARTVALMLCERHLRLREAAYCGAQPPASPLEHPVLEVLEQEASEELPAGFYHLVESLTDPECLPVYAVSRQASDGAAAVLR